jgi:2-dehydro-3-deoxygalactonokinase
VDIFIDWGSTNFHAFLVRDGSVIDRREVAGHGVLKSFMQAASASRDDDYSVFLNEAVHAWLEQYPEAPVLMCGAVGSREGWVQTKYVEAPAGFAEIAAGLYHLTAAQRGCLRDRSIAVTSGLALEHRDGGHDVMRSEEVKGLGATTHAGQDSALLCIPGTHCKWIKVELGKIVDFHTVMTGDLYGVLSEHGSLAPLFENAPPMDDVAQHYASFDQGLDLAERGGDLLLDLWQVRSRELHAAEPPHSLQSFLSGILIGHEVRQIRRFHPAMRETLLVSDPGTRQLFYRRACERFGLSVSAEIDSETAVCVGLTMIRNHPTDSTAMLHRQ